MVEATIPFVDLSPMHGSLDSELKSAMARVLHSNSFICGPEVERFEADFAKYCGAKHCIGISNGLDALVLILRALEIGPGDEVILPANTFIATALAVSAVGARPVLVDIDEATFNLDPERLADAATERTKAVIPVHLYGLPAAMDPILEFANRRGLHVIEDAAQAHGATYKGQRVGGFGVASAFSFYPGKNLGALGDAGAVVTNSARLDEKIRLLRGYGSKVKYYHTEKGVNARLDELQAAILSVKLAHLDRWNEERRLIAQTYSQSLRGLEWILPVAPADRESVWHLFVARSGNRDRDRQRLEASGVHTSIHYPIPVHLQGAYSDLGYPEGSFPVTERVSKEILSLPFWIGLDARESSRRICAVLAHGQA